jgi:hypothetical protein
MDKSPSKELLNRVGDEGKDMLERSTEKEGKEGKEGEVGAESAPTELAMDTAIQIIRRSAGVIG